ncbi:hypothetical protein [Roseovarius indicus]|uniref:hypothetical protein n=1 Tax=Roseovarius indicus TaxID=540747 RepID=UPI0032EC773D
MPDLPHFARFWMICRKPSKPHHKTAPTQRYSNLGDARNAAESMAAKIGEQFLILETIEIVHPSDQSFGRLDL